MNKFTFKNPLTYKSSIFYIILALLIIIPVLHFIFYNYEKSILEKQIEINSESYKESLWCDITEALNLAKLTAKLNAIDTAKDIKFSIETNSDLYRIEKQDGLNEVKYSDEFVEMINTNIRGRYLFGLSSKSNSIFVLDNNGMIFDDIARKKLNRFRTIIDEEKVHYNQILCINTMKNILDYKTDGLLFYEPYNPYVDNHIIIHNSNIDNLKEVFMKEGLEGLSGYIILVPIYINDNNGMCIDDRHVDSGNAYNLIVVQKFSIVEVLNINSKSLYMKNQIYNLHNSNIEEKIRIISISYTIVVILDLIALLLIFLYGSKKE